MNANIVYEPMPYGSILIVDDVESNLYVAKRLLTPYELAVETAMSGYEAVEKIKSGKTYDIIFMDHLMPDMDGIETVAQIRGFGYANPIVALTANVEAEESDIFLNSGFDGFVSKPIDINLLNDILKKFVRDTRPAETGRTQNNRDEENRAVVAEHTQTGDMVVRSFLRDANKAVETLEDLLKKNTFGDENLRRFTTCVHGMKSGFANVNELALSQTAFKLEQAGRSKDMAVITAETPAFLNELRKLIVRLDARYENGHDVDEPKDVDYAYLHIQLKALIGACDMYDKRNIKALLARLDKRTWPRPIKEQLKVMADQLLSGDFDEVAITAEEIIKMKH